jgi:hypothetical protein
MPNGEKAKAIYDEKFEDFFEELSKDYHKKEKKPVKNGNRK